MDMPMTSNTQKPASYQTGIWMIRLFIGAIAAAGINAWYHADLDLLSKVAAMTAAGLTALVIMFTVEAVGRSWASAGLLPIIAIACLMQAATFEQSFHYYLGAPHKAAFDKTLEPFQAELVRTTKRLDTAQANLDALPALKLDPSMPTVRVKAQTAACKDLQAPLAAAVTLATQQRQNAQAALEKASKAYSPMAEPLVVAVIGGLIDVFSAFGIWALEATTRRVRKDHEREAKAEAARLERKADKLKAARAEKLAARRKAKEKAKAKAAKARPTAPFVPRLVANDNR
jgi:hypothetical protein